MRCVTESTLVIFAIVNNKCFHRYEINHSIFVNVISRTCLMPIKQKMSQQQVESDFTPLNFCIHCSAWSSDAFRCSGCASLLDTGLHVASEFSTSHSFGDECQDIEEEEEELTECEKTLPYESSEEDDLFGLGELLFTMPLERRMLLEANQRNYVMKLQLQELRNENDQLKKENAELALVANKRRLSLEPLEDLFSGVKRFCFGSKR